ncbi:uncharacterized protein LOC133176085 [Saccostrea echinata]|uniref:uncharacterized protein LOC133176085 n=1 Tax=Saccostrea echinata TaxID=191078 RepID=UPI002A7F9479|nr:uncharacterized protein LOC133176085 [Saccostrea echinata]
MTTLELFYIMTLLCTIFSNSSKAKISWNLNSDQVLRARITEDREVGRYTYTITKPKVEIPPYIPDDTETMLMLTEIEMTETPDETCWDFEKERCNEFLKEQMMFCGYDEDCHSPSNSGIDNEGKCCQIPCRSHVNITKVCRWPTDDRDLVNSLTPLSARQDSR